MRDSDDAPSYFTEDNERSGGGRQTSRRSKFSPACNTCRHFKTRCIPVTGRNFCQACQKRSVPCIYPGPAGPHVRSSEKIADLQKKVAALTDILAAKGDVEHPLDEDALGAMQSLTTASSTVFRSPSQLHDRSPGRAQEVVRDKRYQESSTATHLDVVDQGIIDIPSAELMFKHWTCSMHPYLPILNLPPSTTGEHLRERTPTLFSTILAVASPSILPSYEARLTKDLTHQLARQVFVLGHRSIELVQACLVYSHYYIAPPGSQPFSPTQYVSAAVAMISDLGLNYNSISRTRLKLGGHAVKEISRAWLACWYTASSHSVLLRQQCPTPPIADIRKFLNILTAEGNASSSDNWLCSLVRLHLIIDEALNTLHLTPAEAFDKPSTQHQLKMSQHRLQDWRESTPQDVDPRLWEFSAFCADLCIHHIAIRSFSHKAAVFCGGEHPCASACKDLKLSGTHVSMLCRCIESTQGILDAYLGWESSFARSLPNSFLMWTLYAAVCMLKLKPFEEYTASRESVEHVSRPHNGDSVSYYLDAMITKLLQTSQNKYHPQSKSGASAFKKLKSYYVTRREICINAKGGLEVGPSQNNDAVYNVFGAEARPTSCDGHLAIGTKTRQQETHEISESSRISSSQEGGHGDLNSTAVQYRDVHAPYTSWDNESGRISGSSAAGDSGFETTNGVNIDWADIFMDTEGLPEFDNLMTDYDVPWLTSLF